MIFRRPRSLTAAGPAPSGVGTATGTAPDGEALDTLVEVLRAYGRFAPCTDEHPTERTRQLVDGWVRHAALGQPLAGAGTASGTRRWRELAASFADHRRDESTALQQSLGRLRDMVWTFVSSMHHAVRDDEVEDRAVLDQLAALREAVDRGTTDDVRAAAGAAISGITSLLSQRRERHRRQLEELGEHLSRLGAELDDARRAGAIDPLTGLANRKEFDDYLKRLVEMYGFVPSRACLLMIDMDDLKRLNDAHGHQAGDEALRQVAACMSRVFLRRCDFVGRFGGDEFAVVLHDTPMAGALSRAEQLRELVAAISLPGTARATRVTLSIGVAEYVRNESVSEWLRRADRALYTAKEHGRDGVIQAPAIFQL
ncbi:MAG TPA: GGDEF domain-containing protein [Gemmatimonadales bacterium]